MNITEIVKEKMRGQYDFGGRSQEVRDICVDSEQYLKVHTLIYAQHKCIRLGQLILLNVIFHVAVSSYHLVKI